MCFVGVNQQPLSAEELIKLLEKLSTPSSYYFLRWTHRVGGFWRRRSEDPNFISLAEDIHNRLQKNIVGKLQPQQPEAFPSPEGQLFNSVLELRWQRQQDKYQTLLLSSKNAELDFTPIRGKWEFIDQNALVYPFKETRFPKDFNISEVKDLIAQRYFQDSNTATIHFVALTVKSHDK